MFPKNIETERGLYLQKTLTEAGDSSGAWTMPDKEDFAVIGTFVVMYSYIDFHLKRIVECLEKAGKIGKSRKRRSTAAISDAILSQDWSEENVKALTQIEEFRAVRNLLAHTAVRRFPNDDAFAFLFKSAEDYKEHHGTEPPFGIAMTAVADRSQIIQVLNVVENLERWVAMAATELEDLVQAS